MKSPSSSTMGFKKPVVSSFYFFLWAVRQEDRFEEEAFTDLYKVSADEQGKNFFPLSFLQFEIFEEKLFGVRKSYHVKI